MTTPQRKYEPIWEKVKTKGHCSLRVEPFLVPRVKKAIIKEKNKDVGFKLLNDHDSFFLEFEYNAEEKKLKTILKQKFGLQGVKYELE